MSNASLIPLNKPHTLVLSALYLCTKQKPHETLQLEDAVETTTAGEANLGKQVQDMPLIYHVEVVSF